MRRGLVVLVLFAAVSAKASTYVVNDLGDASDASAGDDVCATAGGVCTLRAAIEEANAHAGTDTIAFSVAGTIAPGAADYPPIVQQTIIDGRTAPGYASQPVVLVGRATHSGTGLVFDHGSSGSFLYALHLFGFVNTVTVNADGVTIRNNRLRVTGFFGGDLVVLQLNGSSSTVGGADGEGNIITGGVAIAVTGSDHVISDNRIGIDENGNRTFQTYDGIRVDGATGVFIGAMGSGAENVISDTNHIAIDIVSGSGNTIAGNFLGTAPDGTYEGHENDFGIRVDSPGNTIGTPTGRNVICNSYQAVLEVAGGANDTVIQNNYFGFDVDRNICGNYWVPEIRNATNVLIGGTGPSEGNAFAFGYGGLWLVGTSSSRIVGNEIYANDYFGIDLDNTTQIMVESNVIHRNAGYSPRVLSCVADYGGNGNIFAANTIRENFGTALLLSGTLNATVRGNQISGNIGVGIEVTGGSTGTVIHSNNIGLTADLSAPLPNCVEDVSEPPGEAPADCGGGILISGGAFNTVIGSAALGGNIIASNHRGGISVEPDALGNNTWAANSIFGNERLGIDLGYDDVTLNDPDDPDQGPNGLQNFPLLDSSVTTATASETIGRIDTLPSTPFTIHFYSSPSADPTGYGEGQTYLGATAGTTDANGDATFTFTGPAITPGHVVTATATTSDGTSEFSAAIVVPAIVVPSADLAIAKTTNVTTFDPGQEVTYTITVTNSGPDAAAMVTVTDVLPAGVTFVSASGDDATCTGTTTVTCTIAALASGASSSIALVVTANGSAPISNTASVAAESPLDPTPENNAATTTIGPAAAPAAIPAASEWALLLLALVLGVIAIRALPSA